MHAIDTPDKQFKDGNGTSELGTILPAWWLNQIQAELLAVLTAANIQPNKAKTNQIADAIKQIFSDGVVNSLSATNTDKPLSAAMGKKLNEEKLGNSGNQTLLNGRFAVQTENNSWAQIVAKSSGDGWIFEVGPEGEGQFTRRRKDAFATHTGNIAIYKLPAGGTGTHVLATESQIGFVKPVIKPAASEIIDLTKRSEILAYAGTSGNKHIQLTFYNNASSQIVGLPIDDKSPCQMDISIMGAYTVCRVYYFYLAREFVSSVNWNSEELSYSWRETVNKTNAVMLTGNQNINGAKTFSEILTVGRNNHWGFLRNPVESGGHWVFETNPKSNYADGSTLKVNIKYEQTSGQVRYIHFPELGNINRTVAYQDWVATQINAATGGFDNKIEQAAPAGTVAYFAGRNAPAGWLKANGAAVSRTTYAALFAAIGTTYGAGDGRTTFNLPDLRGEFVRGFDDGRNIDRGRALGSSQSDNIAEHRHATGWRAGSRGNEFVLLRSAWSGQSNITADVVAKGGAQIPGHDEHYVHVSGSTYANSNDTYATSSTYYDKQGETFPRNVALLACIKI